MIALSPKSLLATNRFPCEVCGKGFQRDQNLQLHRRGHNLPWKLRQRSSASPRKRVYVCPEKICVHHNPKRALGDLTGIKKHYCRKHGEKKWKCDRCSKRYAVASDWKAHCKSCGTREYRCDCGTLFSRRDSFITHRAFCDALAEESAKLSGTGAGTGSSNISSLTTAISSGHHPVDQRSSESVHLHDLQHLGSVTAMQMFGDLSWMSGTKISSGSLPSLYSTQINQQAETGPEPDMSATALLQKAAQIGVTSSTGVDYHATSLVDFNPNNHDIVTGSGIFPTLDQFETMYANFGDNATRREGKTRDFLGVGGRQMHHVRRYPLFPPSN